VAVPLRSQLLSAFNWTLFVAVSSLNLLLGTLGQLVALPFDRGRRTCLWINHWIWGRLLFAVEVFWPLQRLDYDRVGPGPYVVVSNHGSVLDIPANLTLPLPLRVVGKPSLFMVPFMGAYMRFSGQIPLDADDPASVDECLAACKAALASGVSVLIFPEGTRTVDGGLQGFGRGAFRIAKDTGVPILPTVVTGTWDIMPKGRLRAARPADAVKVQVLEPLDPAGFSTARKLCLRTREAMVGALENPQGHQAA